MDRQKKGMRNAAKKALEFVKEDMIVGIGTGRTASEFVKLLSEKVKDGMKITAVASSLETEMLSTQLGIPIVSARSVENIDIYIDGADLISKDILIKGGAGALTREKILAYAAMEFVVIADRSKLHKKMERVPVEVHPFALSIVKRKLSDMGMGPEIRRAGRSAFITENGNVILDCLVKKADAETEKEINSIPGVVENGIFTKFGKVIIGDDKGARTI